MNKQELLSWVQALPDDVEWLPFEYNELDCTTQTWNHVPNEIGAFNSAVYERKVDCNCTVRVRFTITERGDFKRDAFNHGQWANIRRTA